MIESLRRLSLCAALCGLLGLAATAVQAQTATYQFDLPAQPLADALRAVGRQTSKNILFDPSLVEGISVPALRAELTVSDALRQLLTGTKLSTQEISTETVLIRNGTRDAAKKPVASKTTAVQGTNGYTHLAQAETDPPAQGVRSESQNSAGDKSARASAEAEKNAIVLDEIVVTGTHIRGAEPVGSQVIVLARADIQASGYTRVQDLLQTLPQNFSGSASEDFNADLGAANLTRGQAVDLRGLGASSTLVLINGRRQPQGGLDGSFVDISSIATSAIERVEILPDGASAIYGSDAIGGVINFVLRKDFQGIEADASVTTWDGNAEDYRGSLLLGTAWAGGNILFGYQYQRREALPADAAFYASRNRDFRAFGGSDFRIPYANPGSILNPATFQGAYAIPAGQDGTNLSAADLIPGRNVRDLVSNGVAVPEQELNTAFFSATQELSERLEIFAEGRYSQRDMTLPFGGAVLTLSVPATNPFYVNPFGTTGPVLVAYDFQRDLGGPTIQEGNTETYTVTLGGLARLPSDWTLNVAASYGHEKNEWAWRNQVSFGRSLSALSDPNPATALNVFGDGSHTNPATIDFIRESQLGGGDYGLRSATAIADGAILQLPAGLVRLAVGVDYRDESFEGYRSLLAPATGAITRSSSSLGDLDRHVGAAFAEMTVPVFAWSELSLAGRYEDYSDFGTTFDPRIGLGIRPLEWFKLRGTWGTSFRAPRFNELSVTANPPRATGRVGVQDPQSPTGLSNALFLSGANTDLNEETAEIWTAGFDLEFAQLPGFSFAATYFDVNYKDKIGTGGPSFAPETTLLFEEQWREIITRNPTQAQVDAICSSPIFSGDCPPAVAAIVDVRLRNLGRVRTTGLDLDTRYSFDTAAGKFGVGVSGAYVLGYERAVSSASAPVEIVDTVGNPIALRLRGRFSWERGALRANAFVNYSGSYTNPVGQRDVSSWTTIDSSLVYSFGKGGLLSGLSAQLNVINLLDKEPAFVNQSLGFDAVNASEVGRSFGIQLTKTW